MEMKKGEGNNIVNGGRKGERATEFDCAEKKKYIYI